MKQRLLGTIMTEKGIGGIDMMLHSMSSLNQKDLKLEMKLGKST